MTLTMSLALLIPLLLGLCSILMFVSLLLFGGISPLFVVAISALCCALAAYVLTRWFPKISWELDRTPPDKTIVTVFIIVSAAALMTFAFMSWRQPNGGWDGWAIWNMRARFIFRSGENWRNSFSPLIDWSHPDYPLLLPLSVVWLWKAAGRETAFAAALIAAIFTVSTVALLYSSIALLRGKTQGLLAGIVILASPFFIQHGTSQYADIPIGFFFLATFALFTFYEKAPNANRWFLVLAGLMAGFSSWTKNEGLLFCLSVAIARWLLIIPRRGLLRIARETALFAAGLMVPLGITLYFKFRMAPPNDLINAQGAESLMGHLIQIPRYTLITKEFLKMAIHFTGGAAGVPLLLIYYLLIGQERKTAPSAGAPSALYAIFLMLAGYFLIYLTDPHDLQWHLTTSIDRLFIQLWPTCLFWFFLKVRTIRPAEF
jgi:hypothetical protein